MSLDFNAEGIWVNSAPNADSDMFSVSMESGFTPFKAPLKRLPERYGAIEDLLEKMRVVLPDGKPGLLAKNEFRTTIRESFPNMIDQVKEETDSVLLHALYRDYCLLSAAYCLEPCDLEFRRTREEARLKDGSTTKGSYGKAEGVLIAALAQPLEHLGARIKSHPWLEYTIGYGPGNWGVHDDNKPRDDFDNMHAVRICHGGKDEEGFVLVHVQMELQTGTLIKHSMAFFEAIKDKDHAKAQEALDLMTATATKINELRETMWERSAKEAYLELRTWIYGIKGTGLFPEEGLEFEGCEEPKKRQYRGETGAQSTIIPFLDTVTGVNKAYPKNNLTEYLMELREYRPYHHRSFLAAAEERATELNVMEFVQQDPNTMVQWLRVLNQIRAFRQGHWNFTKSYIIQNSDHPIATGGTPITTWLPNQLGATMELMQNTLEKIKGDAVGQLNTDCAKYHKEISDNHDHLVKYLKGEVEKLRQQYNQ